MIQWITLVSIQTIVELPEFQKRADGLLKPDEKVSIINYLASHPQSGDLPLCHPSCPVGDYRTQTDHRRMVVAPAAVPRSEPARRWTCAYPWAGCTKIRAQRTKVSA